MCKFIAGVQLASGGEITVGWRGGWVGEVDMRVMFRFLVTGCYDGH